MKPHLDLARDMPRSELMHLALRKSRVTLTITGDA